MYNDPVTTAQAIACLFVPTPAFQNLQGILQNILMIFAGP
jgi:hypothetical protein